MEKQESFIDKHTKWTEELYCSECGSTLLIYERTVANGEVWNCKECKKENMFNHEPKEYH